jgi:hypothetical protein
VGEHENSALRTLLVDNVNGESISEVTGLWRHYFMSGQLGQKRRTKTITLRHLPQHHPDAQTNAAKCTDYFTEQELMYIGAIQDHLMQKYDQLGQSNNFYGLRTGPVRVCINTDDAGLFPTSIVNEHRIIKETAIKHFADAENWIEKIRLTGIEAKPAAIGSLIV